MTCEGKEYCKAITLRSGREVAAPGPQPTIVKETNKSEQSKTKVDTKPRDVDEP